MTPESPSARHPIILVRFRPSGFQIAMNRLGVVPDEADDPERFAAARITLTIRLSA
jgi:hypothetical protein